MMAVCIDTNQTANYSRKISFNMKKLLWIVVLGLLLAGCDLIAKDIKPYLCNYISGDLDDCMEGGPSRYKIYVNGKYDAKDEESCNDFIFDYANTPEMKIQYPDYAWMIGCDDNWK